MTYELHAVIIKKPIKLKEAKKIASKFYDINNKGYYRETNNSFRFRNIPKTKFNKKSYKSKKINEYITLIYGKLK